MYESARWNDRGHDEVDWGEGEDRSITRPLTCDQMQLLGDYGNYFESII